MSIKAQLEQHGYVVLRNLFGSKLRTEYLAALKVEYDRRRLEEESEDDRYQRLARSHYMASFEGNPFMDQLLEEVLLALSEDFQGPWETVNRQIIYRTPQEEVFFKFGYHIDGCFGIFSKGWEEIWPGFQILAGVPLIEEAGPGKGGLWVKPGSHLKVFEVYRKAGNHLDGLRAIQAFEQEQKEQNNDSAVLITHEPGDLLLLHSLTVHTPDPISPECTLDAKAYFRLKNRKIVGRQGLEEGF